MSLTKRKSIRIRYAVLLAIALGGCSIVDSSIVELDGPRQPSLVSCSSALGSYTLPKGFVRVKVGQAADAPKSKPDLVFAQPAAATDKLTFQVVRRPDPALTVCLDHLNSVFAADEIHIDKFVGAAPIPDWDGRQFLKSIVVNANDRSVQIIRKLIRAFFIAMSGDSGFSLDRSTLFEGNTTRIIADLEFDPFNVRDSANTNVRLKDFDICLVLEGFTFDVRSLTVDEYCNSPYRVSEHLPYVSELYESKSREPIPPHTPGVLYRPRQTYLLSAYKRARPGSPWFLSRRVGVDLENLSPVVSLGISRAIFAKRNTILLFDQGTLLTACVSKSSEVENFVAIPFEIARSLVVLPSRILSVRINRTGQRTELANAENLFLKMQTALLEAQQTGKFTKPDGTPATPKDIAMGGTKLPDLEGDALPPGFDAPLDVFKFDDPKVSEIIKKICSDPLGSSG
jgi:hypothetical protein